MKFTLIILFSTASLVSGLGAEVYALDELDDLLSTSAALVSPESVAPTDAPLSQTGSQAAGAYSDRAPWNMVIVGHETEEASPVSHPAVPKPAVPLAEMNLVPEPSAVALAGLALVYFLLFGRKRRWR